MLVSPDHWALPDHKHKHPGKNPWGLISLHPLTLTLALSNPAENTVWHPCSCGSQHCRISSWSMHNTAAILTEDNMTHSVTTVLQVLLQNYHSLLIHTFWLLPSGGEVNQSRGVWNSASRNQGCQLSNAQYFIATQKQQSANPLTKERSRVLLQQNWHSFSVPLPLPVAHAKNPPHIRTPPYFKKNKQTNPKKTKTNQNKNLFLTPVWSVLFNRSFALVWIATPTPQLSRI